MLEGYPRSWGEVRAFVALERQLNDDWMSGTTVTLFRLGQWLVRLRAPWSRPLQSLWWLAQRAWISGLMGIEISPWMELGPGVRLAHGGRGMVIHPRARIGARSTIYHRVTVGVAGGTPPKPVPVIGDDVTMSVGCAVLGGITVGDGAAIGANAVVMEDVGPHSLVKSPPPDQAKRRGPLLSTRRSNLGRDYPRVADAAP